MPAFQAYSPTAAQPYQAEAAPEVMPAAPSPIPTQPNQANGAVRTSGGIATVADGILRGFMQGRAQHAAMQVMKQQKLGTDLNNSYNADAQRLYQLHQAGVDEKSPEFQQAKSAVDGSWTALQQFRAQAIQQQQGKKGKGKKQDQQLPPEAVLHNPASTPQEKAEAIFTLSQKFGPPVYGQIAVSKSQMQQPEYQASQLEAHNALTKAQAQQTYNKYAGMPDETFKQLPQSAQDSFLNAKAVLFPPRTTGTTRLYELADGSKNWFLPGEEPEGSKAVQTGAQPKPTRAFTKGKDGKPMSVLIDPKTNQVVPGSEDPDILPPASMMGRITTGFYHYTDAEGNVHQVAETRSSTPVAPGGGHSSGGSSALPSGGAPHQSGTPQGTPGDRIVGHKGRVGTPAEFSQIEKDTSTSYAKAKDNYTKSIQGIDDAAAKTPDAWPEKRVVKEKKQAGDDLMAENKRIAELNSSRTRDLGGIPAEGASHPAAEAHKPEESTHGQPAPPAGATRFMATTNPKGLVEPGNLSIWDRPTVHNADGSHSSEYSTSFQDDKGREVLVPTVVNGKFLTPDGKKPKEGSPEEKAMFKKAWQHYLDTGENLGKFSNPDDADAYAGILHNRGEKKSKPNPSDPMGIL